MKMRKNLFLLMALLSAAVVTLTGCGPAAGSPKAVVKMQLKNAMKEAEKKICTKQGYKSYKLLKEACDTLDIDRVEESKDGDYAVVFFSFKKDGKDVYGAMPCQKSKEGDWYECDDDDLPESGDYRKNMKTSIQDWMKKNKD